MKTRVSAGILILLMIPGVLILGGCSRVQSESSDSASEEEEQSSEEIESGNILPAQSDGQNAEEKSENPGTAVSDPAEEEVPESGTDSLQETQESGEAAEGSSGEGHYSLEETVAPATDYPSVEDDGIADYFRESVTGETDSSWSDYVVRHLLEAQYDESVVSPEELPALEQDLYDAFYGMDDSGMNPVDSEYQEILQKIYSLFLGLTAEDEMARAFCRMPDWVISRSEEKYFLTASDGENQITMVVDGDTVYAS